MKSEVTTLALLAVTFLAVRGTAEAQLAPPNAAGVTYGHIHLNVGDIERHKQLWVDHFGGTLVEKGSLTTVRLPSTIIALRDRAPTGGSQGSGVDHFGFSVPDLDAFLEGWRSDGLEVENEFEGSGGVPQALRHAPPCRFSAPRPAEPCLPFASSPRSSSSFPSAASLHLKR